MQRITITMDDDLVEELESIVAGLGGSRSEAIRDLERRIPEGRLARHDQMVSALSVPIDHESSLEVVVMRGDVCSIHTYAQTLFLERGLRHGAVTFVPLAPDPKLHWHEEGPPHAHLHVTDPF